MHSDVLWRHGTTTIDKSLVVIVGLCISLILEFCEDCVVAFWKSLTERLSMTIRSGRQDLSAILLLEVRRRSEVNLTLEFVFHHVMKRTRDIANIIKLNTST